MDEASWPIKLSCRLAPDSTVPRNSGGKYYLRVKRIGVYDPSNIHDVLNGLVSLRLDPSNIHEIDARGFGSRKLRICGGPRLRIRHSSWSTLGSEARIPKMRPTYSWTRRRHGGFQKKMGTVWLSNYIFPHIELTVREKYALIDMACNLARFDICKCRLELQDDE